MKIQIKVAAPHPQAIRGYLDAHRFTQQTLGGVWEAWSRHDDHAVVEVPLRMDFRDYDRCAQTAIEDIARLEGIEPVDVLRAMGVKLSWADE